jgi:hypothetical protein
MKILAISDIHNQWKLCDKIINKLKNNYDEIYILGDFFDSFHDNLKVAEETSIWLKNILCDSKIKCFLGNHDIHYRFFRNTYIRGTGYSRNKADVINKIMRYDDWDKLLFFHKCDNFVYSHAGISKNLLNSFSNSIDEQLKYLLKKCNGNFNDELKIGDPSFIFGPGKSRGGSLEKGGITWQDWLEFEPIENLNQIVGHTPNNFIRYRNYNNSINVCIDTNLHYVLEIDNGKLKEIKIKGFLNE